MDLLLPIQSSLNCDDVVHLQHDQSYMGYRQLSASCWMNLCKNQISYVIILTKSASDLSSYTEQFKVLCIYLFFYFCQRGNVGKVSLVVAGHPAGCLDVGDLAADQVGEHPHGVHRLVVLLGNNSVPEVLLLFTMYPLQQWTWVVEEISAFLVIG